MSTNKHEKPLKVNSREMPSKMSQTLNLTPEYWTKDWVAFHCSGLLSRKSVWIGRLSTTSLWTSKRRGSYSNMDSNGYPIVGPAVDYTKVSIVVKDCSIHKNQILAISSDQHSCHLSSFYEIHYFGLLFARIVGSGWEIYWFYWVY